MPAPISDFILIEEPVPPPARISVHIPRSGRLPGDHPYFQKRIRWFFIREAELAGTDEPGVYEADLSRVQEIHFGLLKNIAGIPVPEMSRELNKRSRFATSLLPASGDMLLLSEYFVHEHIRTAPERAGENARGVCLAAFRFVDGQWQSLSELRRQRDLGQHAWLLLGASPRKELPYRTGILQWL